MEQSANKAPHSIDFTVRHHWADAVIESSTGMKFYYSKFVLSMVSDLCALACHPDCGTADEQTPFHLNFSDVEIMSLLGFLTEYMRGTTKTYHVDIGNVLFYLPIADALEVKPLLSACDEVISAETQMYQYDTCIEYINAAFIYKLKSAQMSIQKYYHADGLRIKSLINNPRLGELFATPLMVIAPTLPARYYLLEAWAMKSPTNFRSARDMMMTTIAEHFATLGPSQRISSVTDDVCRAMYDTAKKSGDRELLFFICEKIAAWKYDS